MLSDTNLNLCSLLISLMNLCAHKFRNSTRVKKRSIIVILVWSTIMKPYAGSIVYYLWRQVILVRKLVDYILLVVLFRTVYTKFRLVVQYCLVGHLRLVLASLDCLTSWLSLHE